MPSHLHEALLRLFSNGSRLAPELLEQLQSDTSAYAEVRVTSADLTDLKPAEYRADLVLLLMRDAAPQAGIIVEVQLSVDEDKQYAWPAYVANLRARIRRPVHLLVITLEERVARWARKPIELGGGSRVITRVKGPRDIPVITDLRQAEEHVELAMLSALAHGGNADINLAARVVSTAIIAIATVDAERCKEYFDMVMKFLPEGVTQALNAMDNPVVREYMSDFARGYVAEGRAQGRVEGKAEGLAEANAEAVVRLLTWRFGPLPEAIQTRVRDACSQRSDIVPDCVLTARTLEEALGSL